MGLKSWCQCLLLKSPPWLGTDTSQGLLPSSICVLPQFAGCGLGSVLWQFAVQISMLTPRSRASIQKTFPVVSSVLVFQRCCKMHLFCIGKCRVVLLANGIHHVVSKLAGRNPAGGPKKGSFAFKVNFPAICSSLISPFSIYLTLWWVWRNPKLS